MILIIAVVIVLLILIIAWRSRESMAKLRRTVGNYKGADNIDKAPDHVWTDGIKIYSCDECPSKLLCPTCPKFRMSSIEGFSGGESADPAAGKNVSEDGGKDSGSSKDGSNDTSNLLISLDAPVRLAQCAQPEYIDEYIGPMTNSLGPAYDLDPEFVSSRRNAGCATPCNKNKVSIRGMTYDTSAMGVHNDDLFDGDRSVVCTGSHVGKSSLKLLYTNALAGDNMKPFTASCEFMGPQGYLYKETCALGAVYPN